MEMQTLDITCIVGWIFEINLTVDWNVQKPIEEKDPFRNGQWKVLLFTHTWPSPISVQCCTTDMEISTRKKQVSYWVGGCTFSYDWLSCNGLIFTVNLGLNSGCLFLKVGIAIHSHFDKWNVYQRVCVCLSVILDFLYNCSKLFKSDCLCHSRRHNTQKKIKSICIVLQSLPRKDALFLELWDWEQHNQEAAEVNKWTKGISCPYRIDSLYFLIAQFYFLLDFLTVCFWKMQNVKQRVIQIRYCGMSSHCRYGINACCPANLSQSILVDKVERLFICPARAPTQ